MNTQFHLVTNRLQTSDSCSVVVVYEDIAHRHRVSTIRDRLVKALGTEVHLEFTWWWFGSLVDPEMARAAAHAAAKADVIILAAESGEAFPAEVSRWMESWTRLRGGRMGALAAWIGHPDEAAGAVAWRYRYLYQLSQEAGLDYLVPDEHRPEVLSEYSPRTPPPPRYSFESNEYARPNPDRPPRWGLNE
jgi:hypothetical protein